MFGQQCLVCNGNDISSHALPTIKAHQIFKRGKQPWPVLVCCFAHFAAYGVKAAKLPLEMEPVACDNNTILTLKPGDQTWLRLTQLIIVAKTVGA